MKNIKYQKIIMVAVIGILIYPSMVMAVWWNPFSWFKKKITTPVAEQINVINNQTATIKDDNKKVEPKEVIKPKVKVNEATTIKKSEQAKVEIPIITAPKVEQTNPQLLQVAKQMLDTDDEGILLIKNTYQTKYDNALRGQGLCNSKYNNDTAKAKSTAEYLKTSYLESRSGFATNTYQLKEIEDALAYDLETYRIQKESCLSSYKLPNSSILSKLNQLSDRVSSLRSRINNPDDAVKYQNELKSLGDEILSVAGLVGSN
jgi:hypothetical protein